MAYERTKSLWSYVAIAQFVPSLIYSTVEHFRGEIGTDGRLLPEPSERLSTILRYIGKPLVGVAAVVAVPISAVTLAMDIVSPKANHAEFKKDGEEYKNNKTNSEPAPCVVNNTSEPVIIYGRELRDELIGYNFKQGDAAARKNEQDAAAAEASAARMSV